MWTSMLRGLLLVVVFGCLMWITCDGFVSNTMTLQSKSMSKSKSKSKSLSLVKLFAVGFGPPKPTPKAELVYIPRGNIPCSCNSGWLYEDCCRPFHENLLDPESPVQAIRARFSAFVYKIVPFILNTTHPDNKDYIAANDMTLKVGSKKTLRKFWERDVVQFCDQYEFRGLKFTNETFDESFSQKDNEAVVNVQLERKEKNEFKYDKIDEKIWMKKHPVNGNWCVVTSQMVVHYANEILNRPRERQRYRRFPVPR